MIGINSGMLIVEHDDGVCQQFFCENVYCQYGIIDKAYSFKHAMEIGWHFQQTKDREIDENNNKYYNVNNHAFLSNGKHCDIFCPKCGKKLLEKVGKK
jgi:hypothetical protein